MQENSKSDTETKRLQAELRKLKLESALQKNLSNEIEKQKQMVVEAQKMVEKEAKKLRLETMLSKNLSTELEKEKQVAIEAQELYKKKSGELETLSNQLAKYLSPQVYQSIFSGEQEVNLGSKRKKLTVFFSDLVGFTKISDSLESEEITAMLNYYLNEMSTIALKFGGTIDKYVGDAILVFFGDPETKGVKEDAINCVNMAIAMQIRMQNLKNEWAQKFGLKEPLQMRIGINTGYCTVGNFGSENRLDYTVIGGQVNLASRLESSANPGSILISFDTYSQIQNDINCEENDTLKVKGIKDKVRTFEVMLDNKKNKKKLLLETKHIQCKLDVENITPEELIELSNFVQNINIK